jgi:uncharacterized protein (DUF433 family)
MSTISFSHPLPLFEDEGGTIRIIGWRIPGDTIIYEFNQAATTEQIQDSFPSLSLKSIYATIALYLEHQAAVDEYLRRREREAEELRRKLESRPDARVSPANPPSSGTTDLHQRRATKGLESDPPLGATCSTIRPDENPECPSKVKPPGRVLGLTAW